MVRYRRNFVAGGTYFFTVTLADRTSSALVDNLIALRTAFRIAQHERPFTIDAIVILPDHLHAIWTLPPAIPISPAAGDESRRISRIALSPPVHRSNGIATVNTHSG